MYIIWFKSVCVHHLFIACEPMLIGRYILFVQSSYMSYCLAMHHCIRFIAMSKRSKLKNMSRNIMYVCCYEYRFNNVCNKKYFTWMTNIKLAHNRIWTYATNLFQLMNARMSLPPGDFMYKLYRNYNIFILLTLRYRCYTSPNTVRSKIIANKLV